MKNLFNQDYIILAIKVISMIAGLISLVLFFSSCQPPKDPLEKATFPCIVTKKGFQHAIWIECQNDPYKFRDESYYNEFGEKDTIYEPLNK